MESPRELVDVLRGACWAADLILPAIDLACSVELGWPLIPMGLARFDPGRDHFSNVLIQPALLRGG